MSNARSFNKNALDLHMEELRSLPEELLSYEEEAELAKRIEAGDMAARDAFATANMRMVVWQARKFLGRGLSMEDLVQEGYVGLMKAVDKFDWRKGYKFSTYAVWWIKQSIGRAISGRTDMIHLPAHVQTDIFQLRQAYDVVESRVGRTPTDAELAEESTIELARIIELKPLSQRHRVASLDQLVGSEGDMSVIDKIADSRYSPHNEQVARESLRDQLEELMEAVLLPREAEVMKLRAGIDIPQPLTLQEIAQLFEVSRERIRQIETRAIRKLRAAKSCGLLELKALFDEPDESPE